MSLELRYRLQRALDSFVAVDTYEIKGRGKVYCGSLPISMPAGSLRDPKIVEGLSLFGKPIVAVETFAHAREYHEGESVGFLVKE